MRVFYRIKKRFNTKGTKDTKGERNRRRKRKGKKNFYHNLAGEHRGTDGLNGNEEKNKKTVDRQSSDQGGRET